jgi:hypothetical protein
MPDLGYGSPTFQRACDVASICRGLDGRGPAAALGRLRAGSLGLARYERSLPTVTVRPSGSAAGRMIAEHLAIREGGHFRYRGVQGVLRLPDSFAEYQRGRRRQAVRTNVGHARRAGLVAVRTAVDDWEPGVDDTRRGRITPGPVDWWRVHAPDDPHGWPVAEAIVSVDEEVALLHGLSSSLGHARWLIHAAVVESLCGRCKVLIVNSDEAYLLGDGHRYFQQLLGYEVARLEVPRTPRARIASRWGGVRSSVASRVVTPDAQPARGSGHS